MPMIYNPRCRNSDGDPPSIMINIFHPIGAIFIVFICLVTGGAAFALHSVIAVGF